MRSVVGDARTTPRDAGERVWPDDRAFRFHPISGVRASEEVVDQVVLSIRAGIYREGDRLPSTDALARQMGVSRPTVGEAVRMLAAAGVVRPLRGANGGLVVLTEAIPFGQLPQRSSAWRRVARAALVEARRPIEMEIALLASRRADDDDYAQLAACLDEMRAARERDDLTGWVNADYRFHYALAAAAGNRVLADIQHQILAELGLVIDSANEEFEHAEDVLGMHEELVAALRAGDPASIQEAMQRLMELVTDDGQPMRP
jgi:GntR family transcriptional repressor for pyruvate dehydrogenase complex